MPINQTFTVDFEHTDTFGGEANYCWVSRRSVELPVSISDRELVRKLKAFAGFTGMRARVENYRDLIKIKPYGVNQVAFAQLF